MPLSLSFRVRQRERHKPGSQVHTCPPDAIYTGHGLSSALLKVTESFLLLTGQIPLCKFIRIYTVSGHKETGRAAKVNPDLTLALALKNRDPRVSVQRAYMVKLKDVLALIREAENFMFWYFGAFSRFSSQYA